MRLGREQQHLYPSACRSKKHMLDTQTARRKRFTLCFEVARGVPAYYRIVTSKSLQPQFTFPRQLFLPPRICVPTGLYMAGHTHSGEDRGGEVERPTEEVATDDAPVHEKERKKKPPFTFRFYLSRDEITVTAVWGGRAENGRRSSFLPDRTTVVDVITCT